MRPPASAYSLSPYIDGSRFFCAKLVIWLRFLNVREDDATVNASARPVVNKRQRNDEGQRAPRLHLRQTSPWQDPRINIGPFSRVAKRAVSAAAPGAVGCMPR